MAQGTLEGTGPNKLGTTAGNCRDLGFTSMGDNASTSPPTNTPKTSNAAAIPSPLWNMVNTSNNTSPMEVPSGTVESNGANG